MIAASDRRIDCVQPRRAAVEADQAADAAGRTMDQVEVVIVVDQRRDLPDELVRLRQQIGSLPQRGKMDVRVDHPTPSAGITDRLERGPAAIDHPPERRQRRLRQRRVAAFAGECGPDRPGRATRPGVRRRGPTPGAGGTRNPRRGWRRGRPRWLPAHPAMRRILGGRRSPGRRRESRRRPLRLRSPAVRVGSPSGSSGLRSGKASRARRG